MQLRVIVQGSGTGHGLAFWVSFLTCLSFPSLHDTPSDVRFHDLPFRQMLVLLPLCILSCVPRRRISVGVFNSNVPLEQLPLTLSLELQYYLTSWLTFLLVAHGLLSLMGVPRHVPIFTSIQMPSTFLIIHYPLPNGS